MVSLLRHYRAVLEALNWRSRPAIDEAIEALDAEWDSRNVFLIEAPTGYGKTAVSLTVARYSIEEEAKAVIAYPLRTLLEDQLGVFRSVFGDEVGARYMLNPGSPYLVKPVTLTTIDTLTMTYVGLAPEDINRVMKGYLDDGTATRSVGHYLFSRASVMMSNIVVDEAHLMADLPKGLSALVALASMAAEERVRLVLMTATAPKKLPDVLGEAVGKDRFLHIPFKPSLSDPFVAEREEKRYSVEARPVKGVEEVIEWLIEAGEGMERRGALAVFNTVAEAVEAFDALSSAGGWVADAEKVLIHSRYAAAHRKALADKLRNLGKTGKDYLVVATQVVEAGVDITSNIFVSDAAPPTSLVQRAGRFLRRGESEGKTLVWWSVGGNGELITRRVGGEELYKVYPAELVRATIEWVSSKNPGLHLPEYPSRAREGYAGLIDRAYESIYGVMPGFVSKLRDIVRDFRHGAVRAAELIMEEGGSLIRDDTLVPVAPAKLLEQFPDPGKASVPLSAGVAASLISKGLIDEALTQGRSRVSLSKEDIMGEVRKHEPAKALARYMLRHGVIAFVTKLGYDEVRGLVLQ